MQYFSLFIIFHRILSKINIFVILSVFCQKRNFFGAYSLLIVIKTLIQCWLYTFFEATFT